MATIGRASAIAQIGKIQLGGFLAWLLWLLVHIFFLITFRNRIAVLLNWTYSYFTYHRGARLITGHRLKPGAAPPAAKSSSQSGGSSARSAATGSRSTSINGLGGGPSLRRTQELTAPGAAERTQRHPTLAGDGFARRPAGERVSPISSGPATR